MAIIKVKNLKKEFKIKIKKNFFRDVFFPVYSKKIAVKDISFKIKEGEAVAFLGPNGAGKTTTIKMLTGLIYPTSGEIQVLGFNPFLRERTFLMNIGLVMGNKVGLNWDLTPRQNFDFNRQIYRIDKNVFETRLEELVNLVDVKNYLDVQVRKLSLGERMKMELIGSIIHYPKVLFLDEPTIGLDIISKQKIRTFLKDIQKKLKITLLLTSHDMADVEKVCDRVIIINKGIKVYDDFISNLFNQYQENKFVKFIFKTLPNKKEIKQGEIVETGENYFVFKTNKIDLPKLISDISLNFDLLDIDILSVPLETIIGNIFNK